MTPEQFKAWRKPLYRSQRDAAEALGLSLGSIAYYEIGVRDGKPVVIPKTVEMACAAISAGIWKDDAPCRIIPNVDTFAEAAERLMIAASTMTDRDGPLLYLRGDGLKACQAVADYLSDVAGQMIEIPSELVGKS